MSVFFVCLLFHAVQRHYLEESRCDGIKLFPTCIFSLLYFNLNPRHVKFYLPSWGSLEMYITWSYALTKGGTFC